MGDGRIVATGATSLSFEWQYPLSIGVIDFAGHPDQLVVPLLAWLRQHQPELFTNAESGKMASKLNRNCSQVISTTC